MLPDQVLSSQVVSGAYLYPRNIPRTDLVDYEYGGVDLNDVTEGLQAKVWQGYVEGGVVFLTTVGVSPVAVTTIGDAYHFSFTFDQNMNPAVAYTTEDRSYLYWYDATVPGYVTLDLGDGSTDAFVCLDDKRELQTSVSDILLVYMIDGTLYYREQRDRFEVEYLLANNLAGFRLEQVGMNVYNRFQFTFRPV